MNDVNFTYEEGVHGFDGQASGAVEVHLYHVLSEIVDELSSVDVKGFLICFVGDAISHFTAKHHLTAVHVIEHDVF